MKNDSETDRKLPRREPEPRSEQEPRCDTGWKPVDRSRRDYGDGLVATVCTSQDCFTFHLYGNGFDVRGTAPSHKCAQAFATEIAITLRKLQHQRKMYADDVILGVDEKDVGH